MSDLLARLIEAGTPAALVAEVARELARAEVASEAIETRRAKDRERQARKRAQDVTLCHVTQRDVTDDAPLSLPPNENISNPPTHTPPDNTSRARGCDFPRPDWAETGLWADFLANRKAKRLKNTATAYRGFLSDIERWQTDDWPPGRLLEHATAKGWGAIYQPDELKGPKNGNTNRTSCGSHVDRRSSLARAIDDGLEWLGTGSQAGLS